MFSGDLKITGLVSVDNLIAAKSGKTDFLRDASKKYHELLEEIVSNKSGRLSIGPSLKPVKNLPFVS